MDANPVYVLIGAVLVFCVLLIVYILRRPEPARMEVESSQTAAARAEAAQAKSVPPAPTLTVVQKLIAIPYFGEWLGLLVGVFLPFYVALHIIPGSLKDTPHEDWLVLTFIGVWNLAFTRIVKVRLTTPLLPIPLAAVAFLMALILACGVWKG